MIAGLSGAVVMNSWTPAVAVSAIGDIQIPVSKDFVNLLREAYRLEAAQSV